MAAETRSLTTPGLGAVIRSEWTKFRSVRSTLVTLAMILVVGVVLSGLGGLAIEEGAGQGSGVDRIGYSLLGMNFALILFAVLGVNAITGEYASGMIGLSLTVTPNRGRLLTAKIVVLGLAAWVTGVVTALASFVVGQAVMSWAADVPALGLHEDGVLGIVVGWGGQAAGFAVIAFALGVLLRSSAGAIATVLGLIFGPLILSGILPDWFTEYVVVYLPANASEHVTAHSPDPGALTYLDSGVASAVFGAWVLGFALLASWWLRHRDVQ